MATVLLPHLCAVLGLNPGVLAHQGGWDEIALVAVPVLVIALLLVVADRRSKTQAAERTQDEPVT